MLNLDKQWRNDYFSTTTSTASTHFSATETTADTTYSKELSRGVGQVRLEACSTKSERQ